MSSVPHELNDEFPADDALIYQLQRTDPSFAALAETYHDVNRRIVIIESKGGSVDDLVLDDLRKQRLRLKDDIAAILRKAGSQTA